MVHPGSASGAAILLFQFGCVSVLAPIWGTDFPRLAAQTVVDLSEFEICDDCELRLEEVIRLGSAEGPGIIGEEWTRATWHRDFGYFVFAGATLRLFDHDGGFVKAIGREGEGPGEFRWIGDVQVAQDRIAVLDSRIHAWSLYDEGGSFVSRKTYPGDLGRGRFVVAGGDTVVLAAWESRNHDAVGLPLHLTTLAAGSPVAHFGAESAEYIPDEPYGSYAVLSTLSRPGTVWWGRVGRPHLVEWSLDGRHLRTVFGALPWFPEEVAPFMTVPMPTYTRLGYFGVDALGRLWTLIQIPDPEWEDIELVRDPEGWLVPRENDVRDHQWRDARLDVFDLGNRRHLGHYRWDGVYPALMVLDDNLVVSSVELDGEMVPRLVIYKLPT